MTHRHAFRTYGNSDGRDTRQGNAFLDSWLVVQRVVRPTLFSLLQQSGPGEAAKRPIDICCARAFLVRNQRLIGSVNFGTGESLLIHRFRTSLGCWNPAVR